jgi:hypothetical protein
MYTYQGKSGDPELRKPHDQYETPEWVTEILENNYLANHRFHTQYSITYKKQWVFLDPCCGSGRITNIFDNINNLMMLKSDKYPHWGDKSIDATDYNTLEKEFPHVDVIITNPPFDRKLSIPIINNCLKLAPVTCMLLPLHFFNSARTQKTLRNPDVCLNIIKRIKFLNRDDTYTNKSSPMQNHAWFIWEKQLRDHTKLIYV